eukprot:TRINITY_DN4738_c0_g1_i1.p1 TRINITY_DN4738_c0_g1~~TRINITY_DN4738_c0_g1_i1.p1  ORF type:complete len:287 (-),score=41.53 TRINITY_DN4738_c0_g1_i1:135-869(-)
MGCPTEIGSYCIASELTHMMNPPLPDVLYGIVPYFCDANVNFPSVLLISFMLLTLVCMFIVDEARRQIFMRFCVLDGFLLGLRAFTIGMTQLNNPTVDCANCGSMCPEDLWTSIIQTFSYPYPLGTCGDSMFSGHTVHYLLMALTWQTYIYTHPSWKTIAIPSIWTITIIGIASLISCRVHYSDDIIIASLLTLMSWTFYGYFLNHPPQDSSNYPYVAQFLLWLEPNKAEIAQPYLQLEKIGST